MPARVSIAVRAGRRCRVRQRCRVAAAYLSARPAAPVPAEAVTPTVSCEVGRAALAITRAHIFGEQFF